MVDVAFQGGAISVAEKVDRAKVLQRLRLSDTAFRHLTRAAALAVLIILGGIIVSLVHGSWPALRTFGIGFLFDESWNPVTEKFGAGAAIYAGSMNYSGALTLRVNAADRATLLDEIEGKEPKA